MFMFVTGRFFSYGVLFYLFFLCFLFFFGFFLAVLLLLNFGQVTRHTSVTSLWCCLGRGGLLNFIVFLPFIIE
jgi:hypothetical protein